MSTIIGIDLGTTYSLAAVFGDAGPMVLRNALGEVLTPSAVSVGEGGALHVGAAARARATTHPTHTALSFKRDMGTDRTYDLAGRTFRPVDLSALVLRSLKHDAEAALGHAVEEAVVTVPAYFGEAQRQATRDAGAIAGLRVERIINEPTAAALAYGLHARDREARVVVLDLGGGTFDVTVLEIIEGVIEIQASAGNARLGGDDFDAEVAALARRRLKTTGVDLADDPETSARLVSAAERVKRRLSSEETAELVLPQIRCAGGVRDVSLLLSRIDVEQAWAKLLDDIRAPIARALRDASLSPDRVHDVLLVGGSTRMPVIARLASQLFGRLPSRQLPPDEAVALGAAVQGALKAGDRAVDDLVVTDIAPFSMGIAAATGSRGRLIEGVFAPILERGTVIPASRVERFSTLQDGQTMIRIEVYQGEHTLCADNQKLGEYKVSVPSARAGVESVDVRFTYDLNGLLDVDTTVRSTGASSSLVIEKAPGRLTAKQLAAAREQMKQWKLHPRDGLPNATALARADALYAELTGADRMHLGTAIAHFRATLEDQRANEIDIARSELNALVEALRRRGNP